MIPDRSRHDFRPTASWRNLRLRADLLARLRALFHERGFLEVETPVLSADTVVDRHLDPFTLEGDRSGLPCFLQTSPEFCMKRLLAGQVAGDQEGESAPPRAIYQIARVFRRDEQGPLHNPEFTMVEWYRLGDGLDEGIRFLSDVCQAMLARGAAETLSYREAFLLHAGIDPHACDAAALAAVARSRGSAIPESLSLNDRDGWLDLLLVELVQPHLGTGRPTILYDYPATQAALARVRRCNPPVAERFELYVDGIELANGYHELLDAAVLRRRNAENNRLRLGDGKPPLPEESRLLAAMEAGLPPMTGVALGFDRLVMIAARASSLAEVIAFPFDRA
jgi:lysyl-tRNA synthetase class 2